MIAAQGGKKRTVRKKLLCTMYVDVFKRNASAGGVCVVLCIQRKLRGVPQYTEDGRAWEEESLSARQSILGASGFSPGQQRSLA